MKLKSYGAVLALSFVLLGCGEETKTYYVDRVVENNNSCTLDNNASLNGEKNNSENKKIFIIGDSTVHNNTTPYLLETRKLDCGADNPKNDLAGWGDFLNRYVKYPNQVINKARQGSNTLSFRYDKYYPESFGKDRIWESTYELMKKETNNAFLLIQFGSPNEDLHTPIRDKDGTVIDYNNDGVGDKNDEPARLQLRRKRFKEGLAFYIDEARKIDVTPVLVSVLEARLKLEDGAHLNSRGSYPMQTREVAREKNVLFLDLHSKSLSEFSLYTDSELRKDFGGCIMDGNYIDRVHLEPQGAEKVAGYVHELACELEETTLCNQFK